MDLGYPQENLSIRAALSLACVGMCLALPAGNIANAQSPCPGDCDGDGVVRVNELVIGVHIALLASPGLCPSFDADGDGQVSVNEIIAAVNAALRGCAVPTSGIIFSGEANRLNAYDPSGGFLKQTVIERASLDPDTGRDVNGQICFTRETDGTLHFIAGEDTGQGNGILQGWGYFRLDGERVGEFSAAQVGKLVPTYQGSGDNAENYGCGFLADGRLFTTDVGNQVTGDGNGQLIIWFPPFDRPSPTFCKIDITIGTAQQIAIDEQERVYVASSRVDPGVFRYTGPFPTSADAAGGCGRQDITGAPLVDEGMVTKEKFIEDPVNVATGSGIVQKPDGGFYVSSIATGIISEYDMQGRFVRRILQPPAGAGFPYPTGSPLGLGLASDGTLYFADLGLAVDEGGGIGPGANLGTVRRIRFVDGDPQPPETMDTGLNFPDGIGILEEGDFAEPLTVLGSIWQIVITGAGVGTDVELFGADGQTLRTGVTDGQGTLIFRDLEPLDRYLVAVGSGADRQVFDAIEVAGLEDAPDASFYESQHVVAGYGYLETRDGTLLAVNVVLPGPIEDGPYPTVVEYSGYDPANPSSLEPSSAIASLLGYAVAGVNMRGTGCSGGAFQYFEPAQSTDGYDAIEVIAAQPWVKGNKVGMVGISYPGITQLFVARLRPPHLTSIAPLSVISDTYRGTLYPGGMLNDGFAVEWAQDREHDARPGGQSWSQRRMDDGDAVCIANQKLRDQSPGLLEQILENPFYDPPVADPVAPETFVDQIEVPVFLSGAWQDEQVGGYVANMLDRFTGTDKVHATFTNGGHVDPLGPAIFGRWAEFLSFYVAEEIPVFPATGLLLIQGIGAEIFGVSDLTVEPDRFAAAGSFEEALVSFESEPKIRILFENGAGDSEQPGAPLPAFEASFDEWPVAGKVCDGCNDDGTEAMVTWYFGADGALEPTPPLSDGADSFVYDPVDAQRTMCDTCSNQESYWLALPPWDWRPPTEGEAVAYATDPLTRDLVMVGSGSVDLWLSSTAPDLDLQVTLTEVRPDGQEVYVQNGWLRASHRALDQAVSTPLRPVASHLEAAAASLPAGEFALVRVELFPFAHAFRAGSRVRISVEAPGGSRPRWRFDALFADGEVVNTIARSAAMPSRLVLPLVAGVEVPSPLPPCPGLRLQPCRAFEEFANTPG